ncbi:short-chain fatty acid transporter [Marinirhabdus gelatinilytica]|uniref:Short-chain fatty acids transporter n=1 Tax=Marinirhabdus gelatinilytica TaxID=1703343 RepID=A0A370QKC0_9FLAO|nr:TIGR00366 family protein [Marinirhabdus gelatinilytica]RDK88814.1 short-chain fatty acids transporter [Marinirhabdus gelatinilytica]
MKFTKAIETIFNKYLPSPFSIAVLLTVLTMLLAFFFTEAPPEENHILAILSYWENGIWNEGLLVFAYQMMLILVLGHILVLSKPVNALIVKLTNLVSNTSNAVLLVSVATMLVSFFNWGLGLIFGAIMARKVAEASQARGFSINYPLVGAAGYIGLMVWHGGMSGSAPLKVGESGHLASLMAGVGDAGLAQQLPSLIGFDETIFSTSNLVVFGVLLLVLPTFLYFLGKRTATTIVNLPIYKNEASLQETPSGADKIDHSKLFGIAFGTIVIIAFCYQYFENIKQLVVTPNMLNFFMLGLALWFHGSFSNFLNALQEAISGASGILVQFPLYFGIMGIMRDSGMVVSISDFFVSIATQTTLPIFTFFSAGLVNIFVPSGGGQWAVQGPIIVESALKLGVPLPKAIMALAYGDQITNMLQPFWALPLLGITKLKAREILPYTVLLMLVGSVIFLSSLLLLF